MEGKAKNESIYNRSKFLVLITVGLSCIDAIIYINLEHRKDRQLRLLQELAAIEIEPQKIFRVDAIHDILNGHRGCAQSHIKALELAQEKNFSNVLILEDDAIFIKDRLILNHILERFFCEFSKKWDVFFLGAAVFDLLPTHYQDIFRQAINSGLLHITEGNVMDDREISEYIIGQGQKYDVREVGYDAYNAAALVARLYEAGMPVKKVGQGMAVLSNPSKHVEKLILGHKIKHDGNQFLGHQLGNCEVFTDVQGNIKVKKAGVDKHAKVDGIIALIIAMHCSLDNPAPNESYGFRVF